MECLELPVATSRVDNSSISSFYDILYIFVVLSTKYPKTINYANTCNNGRLAQAIERPTLHLTKKRWVLYQKMAVLVIFHTPYTGNDLDSSNLAILFRIQNVLRQVCFNFHLNK